MRSSNPARISMKTVFSIYEDEEDDPLQKQFEILEMEWDSIKQSISRSNRRNYTTVAGEHSLLHLYHDSAKELMALLHNENTPSKESFPNSGHHDRAAVELIEHREADFDDGILRGRRLSEESEVTSGIHGECFDLDTQSEVGTVFSCKGFANLKETYDQFCGFRRSCTDSPLSDAAERGGKVVVVKSAGSGNSGSVGKVIICVVIVLFALAIVAFECSSEHEHILIPT